jgi:hypothetical protein
MTPAEQAYIIHRCACFEYDERPQPWELFQAQFEQVAAIEATEPAPAPDTVELAPARDYRIVVRRESTHWYDVEPRMCTYPKEVNFLSRRRSSKKTR